MLVYNIDYKNKKLFVSLAYGEQEQIVLRFVTLCRPHLRKSSVTVTVIVVEMSRVLIDLWQLWQMGKQARHLLLFIALFAEPPPIHRRTHNFYTVFGQLNGTDGGRGVGGRGGRSGTLLLH